MEPQLYTSTNAEPLPGEPVTVRIYNPDAENGYGECRGALSWLNSARITTDPEGDAVHCIVSVGDPRGGFCFTVRRLSDGRLVIHTPCPGEDLAHECTAHLHAGTLLVVKRGRDGYPDPERPMIFTDHEDDGNSRAD